ncbi:hypothetical protein [Nocardia beijingensis]|uniref:hypothetical protein n=1 Tax=Nocardia beijingensis TaxID=95162 RepID=UPI000831B13D|nr:hypothetical protein [Nocardia beijingensis]
MTSPLPNDPDVHLSVFLHGVRLDFTACLTAALTFMEDHRKRHYVDAVHILPDNAEGWPRLPNERLYLEVWRVPCPPTGASATLTCSDHDEKELGVGNDEQLTIDLGVPVEQTEWGKWVDPDRRKAQAQKFMDHAGISRIPSEPWPEDSAEVKRLDPIVAELFPDMATAMAPENADMVDAFICFVGECFIRFAGARWFDCEWFGREYSFYPRVNPAVECDTYDEDEIVMWRLVDSMIGYNPEDHDGMFSYIAAAVREYAYYHEEKR